MECVFHMRILDRINRLNIFSIISGILIPGPIDYGMIYYQIQLLQIEQRRIDKTE